MQNIFSQTTITLLEQFDIQVHQIQSNYQNYQLRKQILKKQLAEMRAIANPKRFEKRLALNEPIPRNVWVRWCQYDGIDSDKLFYSGIEFIQLMRTCLWFALNGNEDELEEVIIEEEKLFHAHYKNAA